jgi:4'-phosphopantetheinyl transferase
MASYTVNCFLIENINWEEDPLFEIAEHTVSIWRIRIVPEPATIERLSALLNADEIARTQRYYHEKDRKRFITSRSSLRVLLSRYLKQQPEDIELAAGPNRKPYLKQPAASIHYNTSHEDTCVLIAIAGSEIGIDVEKHDTAFEWKEILYSTFGQDEIAWVEQSPDPKHSFYLLWTRKEALAKATGNGLQDDLSIFPAVDGKHNLNDKEFHSSWEIGSFKVDDGTIGSVAHQPFIHVHKFYNMDVDKLVI